MLQDKYEIQKCNTVVMLVLMLKLRLINAQLNSE